MENKEDLNLIQTKLDTLEHINLVRKYLNVIIKELMIRAEVHDASKFSEEELPLFAKVNGKLKESKYGSKEYNSFLKELEPALIHHYSRNSHHVQHYNDGINGMDIVDIVEMLIDWKAASLRHLDANIEDSIDKSCKRFKINNQLKSIFKNSIKYLND